MKLEYPQFLVPSPPFSLKDWTVLFLENFIFLSGRKLGDIQNTQKLSCSFLPYAIDSFLPFRSLPGRRRKRLALSDTFSPFSFSFFFFVRLDLFVSSSVTGKDPPLSPWGAKRWSRREALVFTWSYFPLLITGPEVCLAFSSLRNEG